MVVVEGEVVVEGVVVGVVGVEVGVVVGVEVEVGVGVGVEVEVGVGVGGSVGGSVGFEFEVGEFKMTDTNKLIELTPKQYQKLIDKISPATGNVVIIKEFNPTLNMATGRTCLFRVVSVLSEYVWADKE